MLEKESDVCTQTSGRNTGMLHAGFLYKTSSLKAICAVEGNQEFDQVARELDVPFKRTGSSLWASPMSTASGWSSSWPAARPTA
ncbi:MAG: FAD-dependent oxidoreductase [Flavonifractor plautii]